MKVRTADELNGMTVNERLYATDQLDEYEVAIQTQDELQLRNVLESIHIGEANVVAIIASKIK